MNASPTIDAWRPLVDKVGGVGALARRLHVDPSTLYRWTRGQQEIPDVARLAVNALCEREGVAPLFPEVT